MTNQKQNEEISFEKELLTPVELAELLGVTMSWVRQKIFSRQLPYFKVGRFVRFKRSEIFDWINSNKKEAK